MINKKELVFVVDENNNPLDPLPRYLVHEKGFWHRTTGIWVVNTNKQILCNKRSALVARPNLWDASFGGHVGPNETYEDNAIQELYEELGISSKKNDFIPFNVFKSKGTTHKQFEKVFAFKTSRTDTNFTFEEEEIAELKWFDLDEIRTYLVTEKNDQWVLRSWEEEVLLWLEKLE